MKKTYSGSGIVPIIKDSNNNYYFILFRSVIRKKGAESLIEDAGGEYDGGNIKISAIRELKEESSMLINLEELKESKQIIRLNYVLNKYNLKIKSLNKLIYSSYFIYLELKDGDLDSMRKSFIGNMRNLWKGGFFSLY
jgi:hypothetical protein